MSTLNPFLEVACYQSARVGTIFEWKPLPFPFAYLDKRGRQIDPLPAKTQVKAGPLTFTPAGLLWWLTVQSRTKPRVVVLFDLATMKSWPNVETTNEN